MSLLTNLETSIKTRIGALDAAAQEDVMKYFSEARARLSVWPWAAIAALFVGFIAGRLL